VELHQPLARRALDGITGPRADIDRMRVLPDLGLAQLAAGDKAAAAATLQEAIALFDRIQTRPSPDRAEAALGLAKARSAI